MESQELMVNKWFDKTFSYVKGWKQPRRQSDALIVGALLCGQKYSDGIFALLRSQHRMPAAAILRLLFELDVKLRWCLQAPDKTDAPDKDSCYQRFRRWNYLSLTKNRKMFDKLSGMSSGDEKRDAQKKIQELDTNIASLDTEGLKQLPDVAGICTELSKSVHPDFAKVYARIYQRFSWAVHVDFAIIQDMVHVCSGQVQCFDDPPNYCAEKEIAYDCAAMGCDMNTIVRQHYGWDCNEMLREFGTL
jgi:hypothetical protein